MKFNGKTDKANRAEIKRNDIVIIGEQRDPGFVTYSDKGRFDYINLNNGDHDTHDWTSDDQLVDKVEKGSIDIEQKW